MTRTMNEVYLLQDGRVQVSFYKPVQLPLSAVLLFGTRRGNLILGDRNRTKGVICEVEDYEDFLCLMLKGKRAQNRQIEGFRSVLRQLQNEARLAGMNEQGETAKTIAGVSNRIGQ